jgi:hypothetical protein
MQLAPIQNPVVDSILPVLLIVPATSKLSDTGALPIPSLKPEVNPKFILVGAMVKAPSDAPLEPRDNEVPPPVRAVVLFTESILNNSVPVALVTLN